ncbi:chorismate mutase [Bacteroidota bacterium]
MKKPPYECVNIEEIRDSIDMIDEEILKLLGERYKYVKEIIKYKEPTKDSIIAKKRYDEVIAKRRELAEKFNLSPDIIEKVYKILINYFIQEEISIINENK